MNNPFTPEPASMTAAVLPEYYTAKEVAEIIRRPDGTLRNWRTRKRNFGPPWVKLGKQVLYPRAGLEDWLKSRELRAPAAYPQKYAT